MLTPLFRKSGCACGLRRLLRILMMHCVLEIPGYPAHTDTSTAYGSRLIVIFLLLNQLLTQSPEAETQSH
jgi:hypothetical protein